MNPSLNRTSGSVEEGEEGIASKVQEFISALGRIRKYSRASQSVVSYVMVGLGLMMVWLAYGFNIGIYLDFRFAQIRSSDLFGPNRFLTSSLVYQIEGVLLPALIILFTILYIVRKTASTTSQQDRVILVEDFSGALKTLSELDWDTVYLDIGMAKIGYSVYTALKLLAYWTIGFLLVGALADFLFNIAVNVEASFLYAQLLAILSATVVAAVLLKNRVLDRYLRIASLDALLWELRWFDKASRETEFKA